MLQLLKKGLGFVFPSQCPLCKTAFSCLETARICASCLRDRTPCFEVLPDINNVDALFSAYLYETATAELVCQYKYAFKDYLAEDIVQSWTERLNFPALGADVMVPVPSTPLNNFRRGFEPTLLLAKRLGGLFNISVKPLVRRKLFNFPQKGRSKRDRKKNAQKAFYATANKFQKVLLIDDVLTTGATLDACATALKKSGVQTIVAATYAFDPLKR